MWHFLLHRVSGLVLVGWIVLFAVERSTLLLSDASHDRIHDVLTTGPFRLLDIVVLAAATFHALNGLRLVAIDTVPGVARHRERLAMAQTGVFFALVVPAAWIMLARWLGIG